MPFLDIEFRSFFKAETGAITVDWVVLTAAAVSLGLATMAAVSGGVGNAANEIDDEVDGMEVGGGYVDAFTADYQAYEGEWLAPGAYDSDSAWVASLSDDSLTDILTGYAAYANPDNVDLGSHAEPRYHDQYWMAYNEAIERGLEIPDNPNV